MGISQTPPSVPRSYGFRAAAPITCAFLAFSASKANLKKKQLGRSPLKVNLRRVQLGYSLERLFGVVLLFVGFFWLVGVFFVVLFVGFFGVCFGFGWLFFLEEH